MPSQVMQIVLDCGRLQQQLENSEIENHQLHIQVLCGGGVLGCGGHRSRPGAVSAGAVGEGEGAYMSGCV